MFLVSHPDEMNLASKGNEGGEHGRYKKKVFSGCGHFWHRSLGAEQKSARRTRETRSQRSSATSWRSGVARARFTAANARRNERARRAPADGDARCCGPVARNGWQRK